MMTNDGTLSVKKGTTQTAGMRIHELALQKWLRDRFTLAVGAPVPVVFSSPMDAYANIQNLLASDPEVKRIYDIKDENGTPLYMPYPNQIPFPILSVMRKNWAYRAYQNFNTSREIVNWPTVSDNVSRELLGTVTTHKRPTAWDFKFQIDFHCMTPDMQAMYVEKLMRSFEQTSGIPQTWIKASYPGWGTKLIRMYIDSGGIENTTSDEPEDGKVQMFRTTISVTIEGWSVDLDMRLSKALWTLIIGTVPATGGELSDLYSVDLRIHNNNQNMLGRKNVPDNDPSLQVEQNQVKTVEMGGQVYPDDRSVYVSPINTSVSSGIAPNTVFGSVSVVKT